MSPPLPNKKDVAVALLQSSASVFIHLDPRRERVAVPPQFRRQAHLILEIGLNMPVPIHDLEVDDDGISCTLSFNRTPQWCRMPWPSVFAIVGQDQRGMVWPEDVPQDSQFRFTQAPADAEQPKPKAKAKPKAVRAVPAPAAEEPSDGPVDTAAKPLQAAAPEARDEPVGPDETAAAPEETSADSDAPKTKGRKLPPYLRVVK